MKTSPGSERAERTPEASWASVTLLSLNVGLAVAFLDAVLFVAVERSLLVQDLYQFLVSIIVFALAVAVPLSLINLALWRALRSRPQALRPALAATAAAVFVAFAWFEFIFYARGSLETRWWDWPLAAAWAGIAAFMGYLIVRGLQGRPFGYKTAVSAGVALPLAGALVTLTFWRAWFGVGQFGATTVEAFYASMAVRVVGAVAVAALLPLRWKPLIGPGILALLLAAMIFSGGGTGSVPHAVAADTALAQRPPVVLITVDTLRADYLSLYNPEAPPTPNFDAVGEDSVVFTEARAPSPWTLPSFVSIFSGQSTQLHGVDATNEYFHSEAPTITEYLRQAGYATSGIGRNHFLLLDRGLARGFERYEFFPLGNPPGGFGLRLLALLLPGTFSFEDAETHHLTDKAIRWIRNRPETPFFFWLHFFDPHFPFTPPAHYAPEGEAPAELAPLLDDHWAIIESDLSEESHEWLRKLYAAEVQYVDDSFGKVIDALKAEGVYDEAMIIVASDHGEEFWEHGSFAHGHSLYDELIHVPLMIKLPHQEEGRRVETPVSLSGLTPTILELLGLERDSQSGDVPPFTGLVTGEETRYGAVYAGGVNVGPKQNAVIFDEWKLMQEEESGRRTLFNLDADPGEREPVHDAHPEIVSQGSQLLEIWRRQAAAMRPEVGTVEDNEMEIDEQTVEELRSLGYL